MGLANGHMQTLRSVLRIEIPRSVLLLVQELNGGTFIPSSKIGSQDRLKNNFTSIAFLHFRSNLVYSVS